MKIKRLNLLLVFIYIAQIVFAQSENESERKNHDINKNLNIFNSVIRELDMLYVDSIDINKIVRNGIDYMLNSLDPYTVYYNEDDMKDLTFMTTGEYAGVGSSVVFRDGKVMFADLFEGKPAAMAGVKTGDIILEIDGEDMTVAPEEEGLSKGQSLTSFVSNKLKGDPGTILDLKIQREGVSKPINLKVKREKIIVDPIVYSDMLSDSIGYIKLNSFTNKSAEDVLKTFKEMKDKGMTMFILDLRDNLGGILEEAVQIVNMFVPKGETIVTTKGKIKQADRIYKTMVEPVDTDIPIIVLINESTASASEIVAGSIQDLDRGVLIGRKSFGKGLVQVPREISFGGGIKITTSKYYIPSGRCVQAMDYSNKNSDGSATQVADSLKTIMYTSIGRPVKDGGGVIPDIIIEEVKTPNITYYLSNQFVIFDWVNQWIKKHKTIGNPKTFTISNEDYNNFVEFVKTKDFEYDKLSEKSMERLKEIMEFEGYYKLAEDEFKALEKKLVPDLVTDLEVFKPEIIKILNAEIVKRYFYQKGEIASLINGDKDINEAIKVLNDSERYKNILSVAKEMTPESKSNNEQKNN